MKTLDVEAVQAFVMVADLRSFTRAAEALATTQSAISLKIKRLEDGLGRRLLDRTPRLVRLSGEGGLFLPSARALVAAHQGALGVFNAEQRRLVVGISHHLVGADLPILLRRMTESDANLVLELHVATTRDVIDAFDRGELDAAIILRHDTVRRDGEVLLQASFGWMASPDFDYRAGEVLRLATHADPCSVRTMALTALTEAGIPWQEVFVGGGTLAIGAAVSAGLAVAALAHRAAPPGSISVGEQLGLPLLPEREVMLYSTVTDHRSRAALKTLTTLIRSMAP